MRDRSLYLRDRSRKEFTWHCMMFQSGLRAAMQQQLNHPDPTQTEPLIALILLYFEKYLDIEGLSYSFSSQLGRVLRQMDLSDELKTSLSRHHAYELRSALLESLDPNVPVEKFLIERYLRDPGAHLRNMAWKKLSTTEDPLPQWCLVFRQDPYQMLAQQQTTPEQLELWRSAIDEIIKLEYTLSKNRNIRQHELMLSLPWEIALEAFAVLGCSLFWFEREHPTPFNPIARSQGIPLVLDMMESWSLEASYLDRLCEAWKRQTPQAILDELDQITFEALCQASPSGSIYSKEFTLYRFATVFVQQNKPFRRYLELIERWHTAPQHQRFFYFDQFFPVSTLTEEDLERILRTVSTDIPESWKAYRYRIAAWFEHLPPELLANFADRLEQVKQSLHVHEEPDSLVLEELPKLPPLATPEQLDRVIYAIYQCLDLFESHEPIYHDVSDEWGADSGIPGIPSKLHDALIFMAKESIFFLLCATAQTPRIKGLNFVIRYTIDCLNLVDWDYQDEAIVNEAILTMIQGFPSVPLSLFEDLCDSNVDSLRELAVEGLQPQQDPEHLQLLQRLKNDSSMRVRARVIERLSGLEEIPRWSLAFASDPLVRLDPVNEAHLVPVIEQIFLHLEGRIHTWMGEEQPEFSLSVLVDKLPLELALELFDRCTKEFRFVQQCLFPAIRRLFVCEEGFALFLRLVKRWSPDTYAHQYTPFCKWLEQVPVGTFERMLECWLEFNRCHPYQADEPRSIQNQRDIYTDFLVLLWPIDRPPTEILDWFESLPQSIPFIQAKDAPFNLFKRLSRSVLPLGKIFGLLSMPSPTIWHTSSYLLFQCLEEILDGDELFRWSQDLLDAPTLHVRQWAFLQHLKQYEHETQHLETFVQLALAQDHLRTAMFAEIKSVRRLYPFLKSAFLQDELLLSEASAVLKVAPFTNELLPQYANYYAWYSFEKIEFPLPPDVTRLPEHCVSSFSMPSPTTATIDEAMMAAWRRLRSRNPHMKSDEWMWALTYLPCKDWHPEDVEFVGQILQSPLSSHVDIQVILQLFVALLYFPLLERVTVEELLNQLSPIVAQFHDPVSRITYKRITPYLAQRLQTSSQCFLDLLPLSSLEQTQEEE